MAPILFQLVEKYLKKESREVNTHGGIRQGETRKTIYSNFMSWINALYSAIKTSSGLNIKRIKH